MLGQVIGDAPSGGTNDGGGACMYRDVKEHVSGQELDCIPFVAFP